MIFIKHMNKNENYMEISKSQNINKRTQLKV